MKKRLVILFLGLLSFGSVAEITEDDKVPDMAASINRQKALLCGEFKEAVKSRTCKRLVDNMVSMAYFQGQVSVKCKQKADDPEFKKVPKIDEFCGKAENLISDLSPNE
ncbi:hypothetical protein AB7W88_04900 [Providencia vermicola]|uniref:Lipoprotein n=2 Tax=Providencia TaxID=586 RepID=A0AAI9HW15_PROST|nr:MULTISPECIES: hypothetical protein [Providencia]ELR5046068.1 hypothetical protein [Providencia rettgeri]ELR5034022.1 hypothetical protein [Providencia stuartii]ELR5119612.1 hypothetical protein [Providencia stuartii]ELR5141356.1 hypothetical protein [Providencia stuartii]ELR5290714.1 hypothetical protein [Providencia stuartii]